MTGINAATLAQVKAIHDLVDYLDDRNLDWLDEWINWDSSRSWDPCDAQIVVDWMMKMREVKLR